MCGGSIDRFSPASGHSRTLDQFVDHPSTYNQDINQDSFIVGVQSSGGAGGDVSSLKPHGHISSLTLWIMGC